VRRRLVGGAGCGSRPPSFIGADDGDDASPGPGGRRRRGHVPIAGPGTATEHHVGSGPYPGNSDVSIAFVDAAQPTSLDSRLCGMPMNSTPTESALIGGYGELEAFQAQAPLQAGGRKVLVLITDGVPTDGCMSTPGISNYSTNQCIQLAGQKLAEAAPKGPTERFVIDVGDFAGSNSFFGPSGSDPSFLGNLAQAGGTGLAKCNPNETTMTSDLCSSRSPRRRRRRPPSSR
jgi:hypothetical protein